MSPTHQRLGGNDGARPQVDLGQVIEQQRVAVDVTLQVPFDVAAETLFQRVVACHCDVVAARAFGCQDSFVGAAEQIGALVATRCAGRDADAHGPVDGLAVDGQAIVHCLADPVGEDLRGMRGHRLIRNDDELVATDSADHALASGAVTEAIGESLDVPVPGGVAERVVDRFETVEVDVEDGDRAGLPGGEPIGQVG